MFVYVSTHVFEFPVNTIIAWRINTYHEQGNMIITTLLLPLGHISNHFHLLLYLVVKTLLELCPKDLSEDFPYHVQFCLQPSCT